jgi:hypothetical protein
VDVTNAYFFRGIRQETQGWITQPYLDVGITLMKGEGTLRALTLNAGTWNSLHSGGLTGTHNLDNQKLWYESDFYTTLGFALPASINASMTFTAYTSPNSQFTTVKEFSFKIAMDDTPWLGKYKQYASKPYVLIATEIDTGTGTGQADGSFCVGQFLTGCKGAGTYMEFGGAPSYTKDWWTVSVPLKLGIGLIDYYQASFVDPVSLQGVSMNSKFGFFSVGLQGTVPMSPKPNKWGSWNVHGGVEYLYLGEMTTYANQQPKIPPPDYGTSYTPYGGVNHDLIVSVGVAFTY